MALTLGQKIRAIRIQKGLTQSELANGLITPSMISQIEAGKAQPSHKVLEAISERLETPVDYLLADLETQMQASTLHKLAKAHMGSKDYAKALKLLSEIKKGLSSRLDYSEVMLDLGECYYRLQHFDQAVVVLSEVLQRSEIAEDTRIVVQALHLIALVELATNKHHRAIHNMRKAFEMFGSIQDHPLVQAKLTIDLGNAYNSVGDSEEAFRMFQYANLRLKDLKDKDLLAQTYIMLSNTCMSKNQFELANEYANVAHAIYESQKQVKLSIDAQRNLTLLQATATGNFSGAVLALSDYVEQYNSHNFDVEAVLTKGDIGNCYLQIGHFDDCLKWCNQALLELPDRQKHAAPLLFIKGKALMKLEQFSDALENLQTALDLFQAQSMTQEVADVYTTMAEVYEAQGALTNSIDCLQKMRSSYDDSLRSRGIIL